MINTILVPVDFSANSLNAATYATELAKVTGSKIIIFHAYDIPISERKVASPIITIEEIEEKIGMSCKVFIEKLHKEISPDTEIEFCYKKGDAVEAINNMAIEKKADLIVMGIIGMSKLDELLIGSVASATMRTSTIPVLVIHAAARFHSIKNIVFALSTEEINGSEGLLLLKEIANIFQSKILVLNIIDEDLPENESKTTFVNLPAVFVNELDYTVSFYKGENIVKGINKFSTENNADLIAMIPHKHSLLERLFIAGNTQSVAFQSNIPLIAIPD